MLCNGSITACGELVWLGINSSFQANSRIAVGVSSILTFRFRESNERSEFDYFNSQEFKLPQRFALRGLTFRFFEILSKIKE